MKFNAGIIFAAVAFTGVFSAAVSEAEEECGSLGVMSLDNLPEGIDSTDVRKCANHPLGHSRSTDGSNDSSVDGSDLRARNCEWDSKSGCSNGYCWKVCGKQGEWCWTAQNGGAGAWYTCSSYKDCKESWSCGKNCASDDHSCGCSC